ncbi:MAG: hypothetical protein A2V69_01465 [Candidatus Portnoybacteria bacterium RBG_13_40_8]|uniref:Uncharacterized protein n=1 Tax=Candidatus Portnoybacteria bacterium RBG_13_40_8 TaxID=1801990 RepID=A0A1G2F576_9BACT|nr:MAG: hypothetical protein A2V69_01465 [Candidatus Portnoybacteria bacterium RBG_13_40_8]
MKDHIKNKNIAINLLWVLRPNGTGSFVYIQNLLDNLFNIDKDSKYCLLINLYNYKYLKKRYRKNKNVKLKIIDIRRDFIFNPVRAFLKLITKIKNNDLAKEKIMTKEIQSLINKKNIDILFFPAMIIYPKGIKNVKIITTIYDLQHEYFPKNFSSNILEHRKTEYRYSVLNSNHIIAISDYTKKTIIEKYKINPNKITTIYLGADNKKNEKGAISLPKNFIFYPATFWPHKNHKILIEALNKLKYEFPDLNLVLTGIIKNEKVKKEIDDLIKLYGLSKKVLFLGYIPDKQLNYIYQKAGALVFPSSFEGFGLPIVEAFEHELPVVAANNTSIDEIVGDAGLLFETNNLEKLVECIKKVLLNYDLREQLISKGRQKADTFTWENTAKKTLLVFNKAMTNTQ